MTSGSRFVPLSFRHFFLADIISLKTMDIYNNKTAANARRFLRDLERACPIRIRTILTDNVLCAEYSADLASGHSRVEASQHVQSMA